MLSDGFGNAKGMVHLRDNVLLRYEGHNPVYATKWVERLQRPIDLALEQAQVRRTMAARQRLAFAIALSVYSRCGTSSAPPQLDDLPPFLSMAVGGLLEGSLDEGTLLAKARRFLPMMAPLALVSRRHLEAIACRDRRLHDEAAFRVQFERLRDMPDMMSSSTVPPLPQPTPCRSKHARAVRKGQSRKERSQAKQAEVATAKKAAMTTTTTMEGENKPHDGTGDSGAAPAKGDEDISASGSCSLDSAQAETAAKIPALVSQFTTPALDPRPQQMATEWRDAALGAGGRQAPAEREAFRTRPGPPGASTRP
jgi:hypothetical protein